MRESPARTYPLLALILLVPVPTIGVYFAMLSEQAAGTWIGQAVYTGAKVWILILPLFWLLVIQQERPGLSPARRGGLGVGALLGIAISAAIVGAYLLIGRAQIDPATVREAAEQSGIATPERYIALAVYIATINAVLEEYVWRWFVFRQCEKLIPAAGGMFAVLVSALLFTTHHVFALAAQFNTAITILGSIGVFVGGAVWSWCYLRYRSIWPGYISHAIVDVTIFAIGWNLIFAS